MFYTFLSHLLIELNLHKFKEQLIQKFRIMATTESICINVRTLHEETVDRLKNIEMMERRTVTIGTPLLYHELMDKLEKLIIPFTL